MTYHATAIRIMIASPADVESEKKIIKDIIQEWNATDSKKQKIVLLPVEWKTHASPQEKFAAQDGINQQVLNDCDLLIAVFWTRLGTPTDDYQSGTVEEIERHITQNKPAMIYFMDKFLPPDHDPDQYKAVKEFKEKKRDNGYQYTCKTTENFKDSFRNHLRLEINKDGFKQQNNTISPNSNFDKNLFNQFKKDLPYKPSIDFLKTHDFGSGFFLSSINDILKFHSNQNNAEFTFIDSEAERLRQELMNSISKLSTLLSLNTFRDNPNSDYATLSPFLKKYENESQLKEIIEKLNDAADLVVEKHQLLIEFGKRTF